MENIKFRAWDNVLKKMHENVVIVDGQALRRGYFATDLFNEISKRLIPMMCTNVRDKNDTVVYDGDILKINIKRCYGLYDDEIIEPVIYRDGMFGIMYGDLHKTFYSLNNFFRTIETEYISNVGEVGTKFEPTFEVIGNVYEQSMKG
jgi:hypothetical protein